MQGKSVFVVLLLMFLASTVSGFEVSLDQGWNTVSGPKGFNIQELDSGCSLEPVAGEKVWGYSGGSWTHPEDLRPDMGYYIRSNSSCEVSVSPIQVESEAKDLGAGWHIISKSSEKSWNCGEGPVIWEFTGSEWSSVEGMDNISADRGYWIRNEESCSLDQRNKSYSGNSNATGIGPRTDYSQYDQFYVSPDGKFGAAGTRDDPWNVAAANEKAEPGSVVNFLQGKYDHKLEPPSGTSGDPVIFRSNERYGAKLQKQGGNSVNVKLLGSSHVVIQGFHIYPEEARWVYIDGADHVKLRDNYMEKAVMDGSGGIPFDIEGDSSYIHLMNNNIENTRKHDMLQIGGLSHVRMIGNTFSTSGHALVGGRGTDKIIARANIFANTVGRAGGIWRGSKTLMENNIISNSWSSPGSAAAASKFFRPGTIFRYNRDFQNWGNSVEIWLYDDELRAKDSRYYNNVFHDSKDYGVYRGEAFYLRGSGEDFSNLEFENNIFHEQGQNAKGEHFRAKRLSDDAVMFDTNFFGKSSGSAEVSIRGETLSVSEAESSYPQFIADSVTGSSPGFENPAKYNHQLSQDSKLINSGKALTYAQNNGSGRQLAVGDPYYFFDGWGFPSESGDRVQVGDSVARITDVDNNILELDRNISWSEGDAVGLPWEGTAPDIGVHERSSRKQVIIEKSDFSVSVGDEVSFDADLVGIDSPQGICWQFGDTSGDCGMSVSNSYSEPGGYGVRVRVLDGKGEYHWGTAYVVVNGESLDFTEFETMKEMANIHLCNGQDDPYTSSGQTELYRESDGDWDCRSPS